LPSPGAADWHDTLKVSLIILQRPECSDTQKFPESLREGLRISFSALNDIYFYLNKYNYSLLVLLLGLFVLSRSGLLLYGHTHISHPAFDETASGVLTCDLLDDQLRGSLFTYQYEARSGDSLLEGFLLVPFFNIFGRSLISLKIFALSSAFLTLALWVIFLNRYSGRWAAIIFALLFVIAPPMFVRLNFLGTIASHHIINPVIAAQLIVLFKVIEQKGKQAPLLLWLVLGFLAGLGVYLFYTYIIFNCFCVIFLIVLRRNLITVQGVAAFFAGCAAGFAPWLVRLQYSTKGGGYLADILKHIRIDLWELVRNFCFNIPHSFGYASPHRMIGFTSMAFSLFLLLFIGILLNNFSAAGRSYKDSLNRSKPCLCSPVILQGVFACLFPVFFIICLTLSPMQIRPFTSMPFTGVFAHFGCDDTYRYRWLYPLYPFYFAVIAIGVVKVFSQPNKNLIMRWIAVTGLMFFIVVGAVTVGRFCKKNDFGKILFYSGYNYDRVAHRLISTTALRSYKQGQQLAETYPEDNRPEAYKFLGLSALHFAGLEQNQYKKFEAYLSEVPPQYLNFFTRGVVWGASLKSEKDIQAVKLILAKMYPAVFYRMWGYRFISYKYQNYLVNLEKLMGEVPPVEQWFFETFLNRFKQQRQPLEAALMVEISAVPETYQYETVKGVGMRIGANMLFDPLQTLDFPLDSRLGKKLDTKFKTAFYEGVGMGFADTLCRFWRKLLLPSEVSSTYSQKALELEWQRCRLLMEQLPVDIYPLAQKGFKEELEKRTYLNSKIRVFVDNKF